MLGMATSSAKAAATIPIRSWVAYQQPLARIAIDQRPGRPLNHQAGQGDQRQHAADPQGALAQLVREGDQGDGVEAVTDVRSGGGGQQAAGFRC